MLLKGAYCVGEHFVDPQCSRNPISTIRRGARNISTNERELNNTLVINMATINRNCSLIKAKVCIGIVVLNQHEFFV